jgi:hypothetical protein
MKKNILTLGTLFCSTIAFSQIGINTETPQATLDVKAFALNPNKTDGIIAPRLTREELTHKGNTLYGNDQKGAIIYITDVSAGDLSSQRINITATGYYYFDGTLWQKFAHGAGTVSANEPWYSVATGIGATENNEDIYHMGRIGAGTTHPVSRLHLGGENTPALTIRGEGDANTDEYPQGSIRFLESGATNWGMNINFISPSLSNPNLLNSIRFQNNNGGTLKDLMAIEAQGNIGIGTVTPQKLLHINTMNHSSNEVLTLLTAPEMVNGNVALIKMGKADNGNANLADIKYYYNDDTNKKYLGFGFSGYGTLAALNPNGNFGIGTVQASNKLHVIGNDTIRLQGLQEVSSYDKVIVSDANGVLKTISPNSFSTGIYQEPWYVQGTTNPAQSGNHQNIYQLGSVAIGKNTAYSNIKLDIAGAVRGGNNQQGTIGDNSVAFGNGNEASGSNTAAIGLANKARGNQSIALGHEAETAEGATTSIAMGYRAKAKGPDAVAFGNGSIASGQGSFAMGINVTTASGSSSFAGGNGSTAQGNNSIALGHNVIAAGTSSTAFGANTSASGSFSFVQGYGSQAHDQSQAVLGQWNQPIVNSGLQEIFTVGNGNSSSQRGNLIVGIKGGIPEDGWVAIGSAGNTTISRSKNEKLRVWGNIAATGQLFAGTPTVGSYPDYVFEKYFEGASSSNKEYTFKTLYETEKFIKNNHHLPGVTSIKELAKNGAGGYIFSVSELSLQSLEKVEELYLYTIEQQKQIDELKMLVQLQQQQIDKLIVKQN